MIILKKIVFFLKTLVTIITLRSFGSIIFDIGRKYDEVSIQDLRRYERLKIKANNCKLHTKFLLNCQQLNIFPKFTTFNCNIANKSDEHFIKKRLLKSAVQRKDKEQRTIDLKSSEYHLRNTLSSLDFYIIFRSVNANVKKREKTIINTHVKKLSRLTENESMPFQRKEIIRNYSNYSLTEDETDILMNGLKYSIAPLTLNKTEILTTFEKIYGVMANDVKNSSNVDSLKVQLSYLANTYYCKYKPTKSTLKKHSILKKLKNNNEIIITHPDKGEGVVILNKIDYSKMIYDIISDNSKFKLLDGDPTINREKKLQRFLLSLKKKGMFNDEEYSKLYPTGSNIARIYGTPKIHKLSDNLNNNEIINKLKLRPIISSIGTYNYNLAKYLTKILTPHISKTHSVNDTFNFVNDINKLNCNNKFMTSFDVVSLYTNIPLNETINLAANIIKVNEPNLKISHKELIKLFKFATAETHFLFEDKIYDQVDGVAMGSPLAPVLANLFMGHHESNWIRDYDGSPPLMYKRVLVGIK